jgi:hypothetical protein
MRIATLTTDDGTTVTFSAANSVIKVVTNQGRDGFKIELDPHLAAALLALINKALGKVGP